MTAAFFHPKFVSYILFGTLRSV
ncbi:hypothetical protein BN2476_1310005 [Paraburkholderia piptadeniae]|uniref:Uncharacterized protein n=1 Tax=Paraburkholderia piptadeniae TaxID=1701573 RepID=A0A1N7SWB0_9BURK|nr:hypothetical protein BN2476_1310005 [Paraburkholderia piptadeniae]